MHTLFHTAKPAFMYMNSGSQSVLQKILQLWQKSDDGPLVTMDAGSNIHLLFNEDFNVDQTDLYNSYKSEFSKSYKLWTEQ